MTSLETRSGFYSHWQRTAALAAAAVAGTAAFAVPSVMAPSGSTVQLHDSMPGKAAGNSSSETSGDSKGVWLTIGDSMVMQYSANPNSPRESFAAELAKRTGYTPEIAGDGGAGYATNGRLVTNRISTAAILGIAGHRQPDKQHLNRCQDQKPNSSLLDYVQTPALQQELRTASKVTLAGGRDDGSMCDATGHAVKIGKRTLRHDVHQAFQIVAQNVQDPSEVYVVVPWGVDVRPALGKKITRIIRHQAHEFDFNAPNTWGALNDADTIEGMHPKHEGVMKLADTIIAHSDLKYELVP